MEKLNEAFSRNARQGKCQSWTHVWTDGHTVRTKFIGPQSALLGVRKTGLKGVVKLFSVDFNPIDTNNTLDIHKYLMKRNKIMFGLIKKIFIGLLTGLVNGSNHTQWVSLSNQKCMIQPTLINLHPNEYSQEFHYFPFAVILDRCAGSCNTPNDLSNKVFIPNKTEDLSLSVFNMITGINESKTLTRHISYEYKCRLGGKKCDTHQ